MAPETPLFRGEQAEKPHSWLQRLEAKFDEDTPVKRKVYQFQKNVEPGGKAEAWFNALQAATLADWDRFVTAFKTKWALPATVSLSKDELTRQLNDIRLYEDDLGKTVGEYPDKVYTHVAWAEQVRTIVDELEDTSGLLIGQVRAALPLPMRLAISATHTGWTTFLDEVTKVSVERLHDHLEVTERRAQDQTPMDGLSPLVGRLQNLSVSHQSERRTPAYRTSPLSGYSSTLLQPQTPYQPSTPIQGTGRQQRDAPPHTPFWTPRQQSTPTPLSPLPATPNRFGQRGQSVNPMFTNDQTLRPGSIFNRNSQPIPNTPSPAPTTKSPVDLANNAIAKTPSFPNTPEGLMQYREAIQRWEDVYGRERAADFTTAPLPLRPGTLPIGRKECFLCGMDSTHRSQQCMTQQPLERREQNWRATVNTALYSFRRTETIRVSQIAAEDAPIFYDEAIYGGGIYDAGSLGFDEEYNQGNGQEERT
ncbi:hypothetical protein DFP72DRAFT_1079356 [Ephemerocybe angulata]|uniref:Retrotransposon gag domain-containing protein n=1 Tax=Ephemerocybe angulata TaxID=980116 RepID=A0A8H6HDT5_9AGAR|nr:hypothetical protein DFP72DRAFT_1079356 [Tulosesus angulatus]